MGTIPEEPLAQPDPAVYAASVDAMLALRCGSASCHGRAERPFALYAPGQRRLPPHDVYGDAPMTTAEIDANYQATLGFIDAPEALDTTLVRKPLGFGHFGGIVFEHRSDPECRLLRAWIDGEAAP